MKILVDTNVILDSVMHREPYNIEADEIFLMAAKFETKAYVTANSITDIYYLVNRELKDDKRTRGELFKVMSLFDVIDITVSECKSALKSEMKDYEDALLVECAKRSSIDLIITRNLKDFEKSTVKVMSPSEFLKNHIAKIKI